MEKRRDSFFLPNKKKGEKPQKQQKVSEKPEKHQKPENEKHQKNRQEEFDKNRDIQPEKKPFDKKAYRLKKYSKKYKLEQWEEQRKKRLIRDYQKEMKNDNVTGSYSLKPFDEDTTDGQVGKYVRHPDVIEKENLLKKKDPFQKAKEQYNKIKQDKEQNKQEMDKVKEERDKKLQEYKKKKHERFKKLSKKTKRGQPMMTGRLELLLDKIQKGSK